jgi:hypothetical protein
MHVLTLTDRVKSETSNAHGCYSATPLSGTGLSSLDAMVRQVGLGTEKYDFG